MEWTGIGSVAAITVICYLAGVIVKATPFDNNRLIPIVCGLLGGILGVVGMLFMPNFPAGDFLTAAAVGIVSGLAATGANQIGKQLTKGGEI
ncbi:MAG: phage holin family protein [Neglectibacter timonensis]|uniref:phage holin family protein n=1 Tax=Neglectibacter timonensis TaxID=1776382 RepID=UPI0039952A3B